MRRFACDSCGERFEVDDSDLGRDPIVCPECLDRDVYEVTG